MKNRRINDEERRQWLNNDEDLYNDYMLSRLCLSEFIRQYRQKIDNHINFVLDKKPDY